MSRGRIEFVAVWKKFRMGEVHNRLRDFIPALVTSAVRRRGSARDLRSGEFWALQDVSFEVRPGEAFGIIGPNGAGKSTILKLLTRIMRPTRGHCATVGRVGALLEVAAGFHPDLTGRENIYLQGAIMGMPRSEIQRNFDRIVEFSGIPWFIDTPVKRYSSGMQSRLGFSIAAHLDPDVLIIDEALAVGDAAFQRKALDRVTELVRSDIPVVVVSHQLDAIASFCSQAILLEKGRVLRAGTPRECITAYLSGTVAPRADLPGDAALRIESLSPSADAVRSGQRLTLALELTLRESGWAASESVSIRVRSVQTGEIVFETSTLRLGVALPDSARFAMELDLQMNVPPSVYVVESFIWDRHMERESFSGPCVYVDVRGGEDFDGLVQMNPRLRMMSDSAIIAAKDEAV